MYLCSKHFECEKSAQQLWYKIIDLHNVVSSHIDQYGKDNTFDMSKWSKEMRYIVFISCGLIELMEYFEEKTCAFCQLSDLNVSQNRAALIALYLLSCQTELYPNCKVDNEMKNEAELIKNELKIK
jgi:hypothetical protein